ncbi:MAG: aminodeoxychorismate lyase [Verrucomicrobiales bacterium]|nr:aminodeoxychorismate lyase [Verrucomicrobiales bacterium]
MKVFLNGELVPEERACVSVFDRGFLYGDGLFETIAVHNGEPFRWPRHFARLQRGAEFLRMSIPGSSAELLRHAHDLMRANAMRACLLRITISRGIGPRGYSPKGADRPTVVMTTHPAADFIASGPRQWRLIISSFRVPANEALATFKTCNKLPQILARAEAESRAADEALLLNTDGNLAEAATSNLFWIEGATVCTTSLNSGILAGVMRDFVLELCASLRVSVEEKLARPETLHGSNGVFLSMSSLGIVEATELDGRALGLSNLVQRLYDGYREALFKETA